MSKLPNIFLISVSIYLAFAIWNLKFPPSAAGQVPQPIVPCNQRDPEFHSLRPYQASPCDQEVHETVMACGNDLVAVSKHTVNPPPGFFGCTTEDNGSKTCKYNVSGSFSISASFPNSQLPILGNTELVPNSQSQDNQLNNAERVNEYVSWYLNGVTGRAEEEPQDKLLDFAGPLKKLLPFRVQRDKKEEAIDNVGSGPTNQHDQVIGCINLAGAVTACYPERVGVRVVRLSELKDHLPPKEEDYGSSTDYYIALREWQGDSCTKIAGAPICVYIPPKPKYWAELFKYIPLASTEDRKGEVSAGPANSDQTYGDITVTDVNFSASNNSSPLYFAHIEETSKLAKILQSTFAPKDEKSFSGNTDNLGPFSAAGCEAFEVRTNMGDNLFANSSGGTPISGTLSYRATFKCNFSPTPGKLTPSCETEVPVALSVFTKTPKANEIWERLVSGSQGVFKRFFPYDLTRDIKEIPAVTFAKYTSSAQETLAGDPAKQKPGDQAAIYIPHIGGVYEYFLKGIQTALRPKGYGALAISGISSTKEVNCDKNAPDPGAVPGLLSREKLAAEFANEFKGSHIADCYNDVVNQAKKAGYDPIFAMAIWIEESGGSDYELATNVHDFGCTVNTPANDFNAQISCFLGLKSFYASSTFASCNIPRPVPMQDFLLLFSEGASMCKQNSSCYRKFCLNPQFPDRIKDFYKRVSGGKSLPPFP